MLKPYRYWKSCVDLHGYQVELLNRMIDDERPIIFETFLGRCAGVQRWAEEHGYAKNHLFGLTLREDTLVRFYRSKWRGERCYFIRWSAIEFIWRKGRGDDDGERGRAAQ